MTKFCENCGKEVEDYEDKQESNTDEEESDKNHYCEICEAELITEDEIRAGVHRNCRKRELEKLLYWREI